MVACTEAIAVVSYTKIADFPQPDQLFSLKGLMLHFINTALAAPPSVSPVGSSGQAANTDIMTWLAGTGNMILDFLLLIAGIIAVFYVIYAGFQLISSGGAPEKQKAARGTLTYAVLGIIVVLVSFLLVRVAVGIGNTIQSADSPTAATTPSHTMVAAG